MQTAYPTSGSRSVQIFLPIADIPVNVFLVLAMGLAVGFISGMFGIGGGFLMTPLLIFIGVQPAVAVASVTTHVAASSFSGAIAYWRRNAIDVTLALTLLAGGIIGSAGGVALFTWLRAQDQLDLVIGLSYVTLLSIVGVLLVGESARAIVRARHGKPAELRRPGSHVWFHGLPLKLRFKRSKVYVSAIPVLVIGLIIGFIGAIMGIGGGFLLVPMLIYLVRVPTATVIGTSLVLTFLTMVAATVLHAATNHLVDAVLALILMVGGVIGAQFGAHAGQRIRGEWLRLLLGLSGPCRRAALCSAARVEAGRPVFDPSHRGRAMSYARVAVLALAGLLFNAGLGHGGTPHRFVDQSSRDDHVELYRCGTGAVRIGRARRCGRRAARALRYRRHHHRAAGAAADAAQAARARHLDEYRGAHVCRSAFLPRRSDEPPARRHHQRRERAAAAARHRQYAVPGIDQQRYRRGEQRPVPCGAGAADAGTRALQRTIECGDVSDADPVPRRDLAPGASADRQLHWSTSSCLPTAM